MYAEIKLLKTENDIVKQQLQKYKGAGDAKTTGYSQTKAQETDGLLLLTKKLQDAQRLYEKVKGELSKTKEVNISLLIIHKN